MNKEYFPIMLTQEFPNIKYVRELDNIFKKEKWQLVKTKDDFYQLYFGKNVQVDNMYEYGFSHLLNKEETKLELERLINYKIEQVDVNKYIGHKLNALEEIYQFSTGKRITVRKKNIGVVLGISSGKVDIYDQKNPKNYQFYSIDLKDFKSFIFSNQYEKNYKRLSFEELKEIENYNRNKDVTELSFHDNINHLSPINDFKDLEDYDK